MKTKLLLLFIVISIITTAQDSVVKKINLHLEKAQAIYQTGLILNGAGAWCGVIGAVGYNQQMLDKRQLKTVMFTEITFHLVGTGIMLYSRRHVNRALKISATGLRYSF